MKKHILTMIMAMVIITGMITPASAAGTCAILRSWQTGDDLTAPDLTNSFVVVGQTNMVPACLDGESTNLTAMQTVHDPFPSGVESLAGNLKGELERLRFMVKQTLG